MENVKLEVGEKVIKVFHSRFSGYSFDTTFIEKVNKTTYKVNGNLYYIDNLKRRESRGAWDSHSDYLLPYTEDNIKWCKEKTREQIKKNIIHQVKPALDSLIEQYGKQTVMKILTELFEEK